MTKNEKILGWIGIGLGVGAVVSAFVIAYKNKPTNAVILDNDKAIPIETIKDDSVSNFGGMVHHGGGGGFHGGAGRGFGIPSAYGYPQAYYDPNAMCKFIDASGRTYLRSCDPNVANVLDN